jgi:hypothetical protein
MAPSTERHPEVSGDHTSYEQLASQRSESAACREGYAEAQRAHLIGQAVRERRLALGLSQIELLDPWPVPFQPDRPRTERIC